MHPEVEDPQPISNLEKYAEEIRDLQVIKRVEKIGKIKAHVLDSLFPKKTNETSESFNGFKAKRKTSL